MKYRHILVEGKMVHRIVKEQAFNPENYEPGKLKAMDQYELLKTEKELSGIFDARGARENDELVINAYWFIRAEMKRRGIEVEFHKILGRLTAAEEGGKVKRFLMQGLKKIQELGPIVWKPKFISMTGSALFVDDKNERVPNDLDTVFRDDEINATLLLKVDRIFEKYFGVRSHPIAEPFGPNWRHLPVWDLALIPRKDITVEEMNEPGFTKEFYEATGTGVQAEARKSAQEDEIKMGRYFFGMKPTKGYRGETKMSVNGLMEFISEDDYPILVEKKYDGAKLIVFKDGKNVTIYTDDGGNVTSRLPKSIDAIKKLNVKSAIFEMEAELWRDGKHMPREMMAGYLHEKREANDDDVMMNVYGIVYKDGESLHKKEESERRRILEGIKFGQSTNDKPNMKLQLNLVKSVVAKNAKELRSAVEDLRRRPGSEGVVVKKFKSRYYLNRNSKGGWYKLHNTAMIAGIVIEKIGTKTAGVYTYRYGIDPGKYDVRPGDLAEVKDKDYMEVGTSFSTNNSVERGGIIEIEFSTLNFVKDERSGTARVTAWVPRFMRELKDRNEPDGVDEVVNRARKEGILREKRITQTRGVIYESQTGVPEVEYLDNYEYEILVAKDHDTSEWLRMTLRAEAFFEAQEPEEKKEDEKSVKIDVGYRARIKKAEAAAKKMPKYWAVIENHFRTRSQHKDFRLKMNGRLEGRTLTDQPEGSITEDIKTIEQGRKWQEAVKYKFRPNMDPTTHVVVVKKSKQPLVWLKFNDKFMGKYAATEPGTVGATRFGWGVIILEDEGFAYPTIKKPFFEEYFLDMKKYKGRMVIRLIPVGERWKKPPKGKLQWQAWFNLKDQTPYLLSRRARVKRDYVPDGERTTPSGLPPEWEKKISTELRWWDRNLSRKEKLDKMGEAYNDLIERKILKGHLLKEAETKQVKYIVRRNWWRGQIVVRGMPVQYWDLLIDSGKAHLDGFRLESDPLIKEKLERGIPAVYRKITGGPPKGGGFKDWMTFEGEIPPGHPENPNKRIPAHKKIIDRGTANWIEESDMFHQFRFDGKGLSGLVVIKRESPGANIWVMKRGKRPGEEM